MIGQDMNMGWKIWSLRSTGKNSQKRNVSGSSSALHPSTRWAQMARDVLLRIHALVILAALAISGLAMAQYNSRTERLDKIPDPLEVPSPAEIDALEARAMAGDWALKQQFAAAYLYEHQKLEYWNWGCHHLKHGHVCRAMATRTESGERFLREIIDLAGNGLVDKNTLARFQSDYARRRLYDARPDFSPQHPACQEAVRYYERAIENEFAYWGKSCVAVAMREKYWHGQCVKKDIEKANYFTALSVGCPSF